MTTETYPIVGSHYRPPAKAILQVLAAGTELLLIPEPSNEYDENAIMVVVMSDKIPDTPTLDEFAQGFGYTSKTIHAASAWHLGYIPRVIAARLLWKEDHQGRLVFGPDGGPKVAVEA